MKVFISSVRQGLEAERDQLPGLILALGHEPLRFEDFTAQPVPPREACMRGVKTADVYLLLLGSRYGSRMKDSGLAPTEEELNLARREGIPILTFRKTGISFDADQAKFAERVEKYEEGWLRDTFTDTTELCVKVAAALRNVDDRIRLRASSDAMAQGGSVSQELAIDWLQRFQWYYRLWSSISGVCHDLEMYVSEEGRSEREEEGDRRARSALFFFTEFLARLSEFVDALGGLWILPDADIEIEVADAVYKLGWHSPFSEAEFSWLRVTYRMLALPEAWLFQQELLQTEEGLRLAGKWEEWAKTCSGEEGSCAESCEVHLLIEQAKRYMRLIDTSWYQVATWYRYPPERLGTDSTNPLSLYRAYRRNLGRARPPPESGG